MVDEDKDGVLDYSAGVRARWSRRAIGSLVVACCSPVMVVVFAYVHSFCCATVGIFGLSVVGIVMGGIAIMEIKEARGALRGFWFGVAGILVGAGWSFFLVLAYFVYR